MTCCIASYLSSAAQTAEWWERTVRWDGVSHWSHYIKFSPAYLGPNALPVPSVTNGLADSNHSVTISAAGHFMPGDRTLNATIKGNYSIVKNKVSVDAMWVPVEFYTMSHKLKEERHVFYLAYNRNKAMGDLHLNFNVQLLNPNKHKHALAFRAGYRYPTSSNVASARMTDAPGYFFDVSTGGALSKNRKWKYMAMAGFLVWQLNNDQPQNDAFLFGTGVEYNHKTFQLQTTVAGFLGYLNDGDKPVVGRIKAGTVKPGLNWQLQLQQGFHDFRYTSIEVGTKYIFKTKQ
ncbi:hypothetical protein ESA94_07905 [Lacibacter luteus]|uniref:Uncharacterized protein n=1 Tax=Lacibacter luteus TaxID=2508719 RepID=A0A4V1M7K4_9BACT|nr:hypothetical protein [Lacibacter luteus]RXK60385.1 hypothetical protein ESA94_07905 [Lacibacter luteus]